MYPSAKTLFWKQPRVYIRSYSKTLINNIPCPRNQDEILHKDYPAKPPGTPVRETFYKTACCLS